MNCHFFHSGPCPPLPRVQTSLSLEQTRSSTALSTAERTRRRTLKQLGVSSCARPQVCTEKADDGVLPLGFCGCPLPRASLFLSRHGHPVRSGSHLPGRCLPRARFPQRPWEQEPGPEFATVTTCGPSCWETVYVFIQSHWKFPIARNH